VGERSDSTVSHPVGLDLKQLIESCSTLSQVQFNSPYPAVKLKPRSVPAQFSQSLKKSLVRLPLEQLYLCNSKSLTQKLLKNVPSCIPVVLRTLIFPWKDGIPDCIESPFSPEYFKNTPAV